MKKLIRLTPKGLQTFYAHKDHVMVFLSGKPLCAAVNELPKHIKEEIGNSMPEKVFGHKYLGNGKVFKVFRGNCSGAIPFQFKTIEEAVEAFRQIRREKEKAKIFKGNLWIGNIINDEFQALEKPMMQLL